MIGDENELILHAVWAGIFAYFIALGSVNPHVQKGRLLAELASTALLHGTYDAFSDSLIGVGIAVLSIVIFIAYYRSGEVLQGKLTALLQGAGRAQPQPVPPDPPAL